MIAAQSLSNPILQGLNDLHAGQPLEQLMELRETALPTPAAWLEAGWDALAGLQSQSNEAKWLVALMRNAWVAAGPVGRTIYHSWAIQHPIQAQSLWVRALAQLHPGGSS